MRLDAQSTDIRNKGTTGSDYRDSQQMIAALRGERLPSIMSGIKGAGGGPSGAGDVDNAATTLGARGRRHTPLPSSKRLPGKSASDVLPRRASFPPVIPEGTRNAAQTKQSLPRRTNFTFGCYRHTKRSTTRRSVADSTRLVGWNVQRTICSRDLQDR